jgi:hypothetical protein
MQQAIDALDAFYAHCMETFHRKNRGYANTEVSGDVLENFRSEARDHEISMLKYARIMRGKHEKAWKTFVNHGYAPDKAWRILKDRVNYALLEYLIALDRGDFTEEDVLDDTGEDA